MCIRLSVVAPIARFCCCCHHVVVAVLQAIAIRWPSASGYTDDAPLGCVFRGLSCAVPFSLPSGSKHTEREMQEMRLSFDSAATLTDDESQGRDEGEIVRLSFDDVLVSLSPSVSLCLRVASNHPERVEQLLSSLWQVTKALLTTRECILHNFILSTP